MYCVILISIINGLQISCIIPLKLYSIIVYPIIKELKQTKTKNLKHQTWQNRNNSWWSWCLYTSASSFLVTFIKYAICYWLDRSICLGNSFSNLTSSIYHITILGQTIYYNHVLKMPFMNILLTKLPSIFWDWNYVYHYQ